MPGKNVIKLPDNISDEIGAILDPFGNAVHATLSFDLVGEDVLVTEQGQLELCLQQLQNMLVLETSYLPI